MAQAPLPNGTGGYQLGDGTVGEAILSVQGAPTALTAAATATAAQLAAGLFTFNGTAGNLTLPTVADLEEGIPSATKVNAAFDFSIINIDLSYKHKQPQVSLYKSFQHHSDYNKEYSVVFQLFY
jgi:hypothetical protein